jgi:hypothetical protein
MAALSDQLAGQDPVPPPTPSLSQLVPGPSLRRQLLVGILVVILAFALVVAPQESFRRTFSDWRHNGWRKTSTLEGGARKVNGPLGYRSQAATVALGDGRVLIWGGRAISTDSGDIYDPATGSWEHLPVAPGPPRYGAAAVWTGQEALIWGGWTNDALDPGGIAFNPSSGTWRELPAAPVELGAARAIALDGGVLIAGGQKAPSKTVSLWLDLQANAWTVVPAPFAAINLLRDGARALATGPQALTVGRMPASGWPVFAFSPARMAWEQVAGPLDTEWMTLAVAGDGTLSAVTREGSNEPLRAYEWTGGAWHQVGVTAKGAYQVETIEIRSYAPVSLWTGKRILVGGDGGLTSWDPSARRFAARLDDVINTFGGTAVWTGSSAVALSSQNSLGWVWTPQAP